MATDREYEEIEAGFHAREEDDYYGDYQPTEPNTCCEGKLHSIHCWWVVHNDDGRDQATGDP